MPSNTFRLKFLCCPGGGAGAGTTYEALKGADSVWAKVRSSQVLVKLLYQLCGIAAAILIVCKLMTLYRRPPPDFSLVCNWEHLKPMLRVLRLPV